MSHGERKYLIELQRVLVRELPRRTTSAQGLTDRGRQGGEEKRRRGFREKRAKGCRHLKKPAVGEGMGRA